jgi:hypothetical protein
MSLEGQMAIPALNDAAVREEARLCARYHAQIEIVDRDERGSIRGHVMRLFRSKGTLRLGDEVRLEIDVVREGGHVRAGAQSPMSLRAFMAAPPYMEAFFNRRLGRCQIAAGQYDFIDGPTETPAMDVPSSADVAAAWARAGVASWRPSDPPADEIEEEAVVELRDQDGGRTSSPSQFNGWLEAMKDGDFLTFVHRDGGQLEVRGPSSGPFSVRCSDASGQVIAETRYVGGWTVRDIIRQYIRGDTPGAERLIRGEPKRR